MTVDVVEGAFVERGVLRFELRYPHPVDAVWEALTDPEQLAVWFMPLEIEPRVGGRFRMPRADASVRGAGVVTAFERGRVLELSFEEGESHFGPGCRVRFEVEDHPGGSRVTFVHQIASDVVYREGTVAQPAGPGTFPPGTAAGWHGFGEGLGRHLDGQSPVYDTEDERIMNEREVAYTEVLDRARRHWRS